MGKFLLSFILLTVTLYCYSQTIPEMIFVETGSFKMGSSEGYDDETPIHSVKLSSFYISKFEITVAQYREFCTATGTTFPATPSKDWYEEHDAVSEWKWTDSHPIVNITWFEAIEYCEWLSEETGETYTLPTEAQWEYASRGGKNSKAYKYSGSDNINEVAWYDETTYERGTRPVGQLKANELGIYDMSGNACEWCLDGYQSYSSGTKTDPFTANTGPYRVIRGGCWYFVEDMNRVSFRDGPKPFLYKFYYGFRIVKNIEN
jgi:formylglycine-generating enzyme required for sulfatase activity